MKTLVLVAVVVMGCGPARLPGAPAVGTACDGAAPECSSAADVSMCEGGKWVEYPCPSECRNAQERRCDWSAVALGDACPASFGGGALACKAGGTAALGCRNGVVVEITCPRCSKTSSGFDCW